MKLIRSADELEELERLLQQCEVQAVRSGVPLPLGAHLRGDGVNFAIFSRHATGVRLDFFDHLDDAAPARTIILHAGRNKTGDIWHVWVAGIRPGQLYGYRLLGPYEPREGHRFNPVKLLVDPHATAVALVPQADFHLALGFDPASPQQRPVALRDRRCRGRAEVHRRPSRISIGGAISRCAFRGNQPSFTSCTCAATRSIPAPPSSIRGRTAA